MPIHSAKKQDDINKSAGKCYSNVNNVKRGMFSKKVFLFTKQLRVRK